MHPHKVLMCCSSSRPHMWTPLICNIRCTQSHAMTNAWCVIPTHKASHVRHPMNLTRWLRERHEPLHHLGIREWHDSHHTHISVCTLVHSRKKTRWYDASYGQGEQVPPVGDHTSAPGQKQRYGIRQQMPVTLTDARTCLVVKGSEHHGREV